MLCPMFCLICLTNIGNSYDRGTQLELELKCQANIPRYWEGAFVGALKSRASGIRISGNSYIKKSPDWVDVKWVFLDSTLINYANSAKERKMRFDN